MKVKNVTGKDMASRLKYAQATLQGLEDQINTITEENDRFRKDADILERYEESAVYWARKANEWQWGEFFAGLIIGGGILIVYNMFGC